MLAINPKPIVHAVQEFFIVPASWWGHWTACRERPDGTVEYFPGAYRSITRLRAELRAAGWCEIVHPRMEVV